MSPRQIAALSFLIIAPLGLVGGLAVLWSRAQYAENREQTERLLERRLSDVSQTIDQIFVQLGQRSTAVIDAAPLDLQRLKQIEQREPLVRAVLLCDTDGRLLYPLLDTPATGSHDDFEATLLRLARNGPWTSLPSSATSRGNPDAAGLPSYPQLPGGNVLLRQKAAATLETAERVAATSGWEGWYYEQGLQLLYWKTVSEDRACAVILERPRWISEVVAALPDTSPREALSPERIALFDSADRLIYQWGGVDEDDRMQLLAELQAPTPIDSWRLRFFANPAAVPTLSASQLPLWLSLVALALGVLAAAVVLYRDYTTALRSASQRVSFVNQVSHELRTPLTNIRLYAEMLQREIAADSTTYQKLDIIQSESQRLGRLVENVLAFARLGRNELQLHRRLVVPDEVVDRVVIQFTPAFERLGVRVQRQRGASTSVKLDADVIEQILVNLLTNVEKYASSGEQVRIETNIENEAFVLTVSDDGPGIPPHLARRLFEPFVRGSDALNAPAGTGIGLSIARGAARRHGGSLELVDSRRGAVFRCRLPLDSFPPTPASADGVDARQPNA